jgi:hypothetical protein
MEQARRHSYNWAYSWKAGRSITVSQEMVGVRDILERILLGMSVCMSAFYALGLKGFGMRAQELT